MPDGVTSIDAWAFGTCLKLKSVTIPRSVTSIGENAFTNCSFSLTIYGEAGSYAETYAKKYNIPFVDTIPTTAPNLNTASEWARSEITSAVNKGFVPVDIQNNYTNVITRQEY